MRRAWRWWFLAEAIAGQISTPRMDVAAVDADVEALIRASWLWACVESFASGVDAAWRDSRCRAAVRWLTSGSR